VLTRVLKTAIIRFAMQFKSTNLKAKIRRFSSNFSFWMTPGIGVKRWLLVILAGTTFIALGFAVILLDTYRTTTVPWLRHFLVTVSLSSLPRWLRFTVFGGIGLVILLFGIVELNRSVLRPFMKPGQPLTDTISNYRKKAKGPKIVAIGGGTGLSSLLRGMKKYSHNITAIVTVADDGGSSGELRRNLGILPPGDIRNCLTALADDEEMISHIFQYRFGDRAGVNGHSLGNLFISALTDITGSFEEAVAESGRVLAVRGRVMPSTLHDVKLVAEIKLPNEDSEVKVVGESQIPKTDGRINRLWIEPSNPLPFPPAVQAILSADLIVIGPGSLYTSVLPNLLVPGLADAIRASKALKFFIVNVANQAGETTGYKCLDHIRVIEKHLHDLHFDLILCNNNFSVKLPKGIEYVLPDSDIEEQYSVYFAHLVNKDNPWRHDSDLLAETISDLYYEKTGPLVKGKLDSVSSENGLEY
jgi:uncharacterized cofD-like protein